MLPPPNQDEYPENDGFEVDISDLVKKLISIVRQNILLIAGIVLGAIVVGGILTLLITPKYQASSHILIENQADQIIEGGDLQEAITSNEVERFLQTQLGIIKSRALTATVIESAKLDTDPSFFEAFGSEMPVEVEEPGQKLDVVRKNAAIDLLLENLYVAIPTDSRIASVTVTSRNPELSAKLANVYAERFIEYNLNQKYDSSSYARKFLGDQLQEARNKLTQSEEELNRYARFAGLIRITDDEKNGGGQSTVSVTNSQLMQVNAAAAQATAERIAAQDRWRTIANQPPLTLGVVNSNNAIMQLLAQKATAESELADERSRHQDGFTTVKAKRAKIAELDRRIDSIANSIKQSAKLSYEAAVKQEETLGQRVEELREEALKEQDRGVQYSVLKRIADTNRTLYESLLSRYNQLNASAGASSNNITIVDRAVVPLKPSSPNLLLNLFLALVAGLGLAAAIVTLRELLDDAIHSPTDVEKKLGLPLLGLIPKSSQNQIETELANSRSSLSEAFRSLVTNLGYSTANGLPEVLMITSSGEGEGKSTTASSIAMDIARLGKRTLLVDADMRRPTLHRIMDDRSQSGLTDILTGQKTLSEVVHGSKSIDTLDYVSALPIPPNPSIILAGDNLTRFIQEARSKYDVVVLDCPPLLGLSDVPLVVKHVDGVLFVIDASSFHRGAVKSAMRRLSMSNANMLGVVLNRFAPKSGSDEDAYYGYKYYNYGHDQG